MENDYKVNSVFMISSSILIKLELLLFKKFHFISNIKKNSFGHLKIIYF